MYDDTACFDPSSIGIAEGGDDVAVAVAAAENHANNNSFEENMHLSTQQHLSKYQQVEVEDASASASAAAAAAAAMELEFQKHVSFPMENHHQPNWGTGADLYNMSNFSNNQEDQQTSFNLTQNYSQTPPPDLLNLFHLTRSTTLLPNSFTTAAMGAEYDPLLHLNLPPPPQPPMFRDLFHAPSSSLFERDAAGGVPFEFTGRETAAASANKTTKHFVTERQRREHYSDKFKALRDLVPNPTKTDRASVVAEAIDYIKELLRTVDELKLLVEKKRCGRMKRQKAEGGCGGDGVDSMTGDPDHAYHNNPSLRSSWLQRKSKDTEVDVRIIDDEVTIKLVQRKKIDCLLYVSRILDDLHLDLHHVAGGHVGDYYSFLFNSKIYEGSSIYASAIANKLIEVMDKHYASASAPSTSSY